MKTQSDWFTSWFDTPYYHILYKDRDGTEARVFMQNITKFLKLPNHTHILDLACGKGRHSLFLNSLGYKVTGVDLSENNIEFANKFSNEDLSFKVHDMRDAFIDTYNAIFNLFTSFGYFEDDKDDINVLKNIKNGLQKNGLAVIDFLNVSTVHNNLVKKEIKTVEGIDFNIQRSIKNGFIIKEISFFADAKNHKYIERVKYLDLEKFTLYIEKSGLKITHVFGDYDLSPFNENTSNRLIFVVS